MLEPMFDADGKTPFFLSIVTSTDRSLYIESRIRNHGSVSLVHKSIRRMAPTTSSNIQRHWQNKPACFSEKGFAQATRLFIPKCVHCTGHFVADSRRRSGAS